jgi:hypothetical protein
MSAARIIRLLRETLPQVEYPHLGVGPLRKGVFRPYHIDAICKAFRARLERDMERKS